MALVRWRGWGPGFGRWPSILDDDSWDNLTEWPDLSGPARGLDVYETDNSIVVEAQIPGVREDDVEVSIDNNVLCVTAEAKDIEEKKEKKVTVYKASRRSTFNYSATLPRTVDATKAKAEVENGVVTITVPKTETEKPKKIEVKKKV